MNLQGALPIGILQVVAPDHPFTYEGPDFLLSHSSGLIAVFELKDSDQDNQMKLLCRLTNSLIAYPAETQMLLLVNEKIRNDLVSRLGKYFFNKLVEVKDLKRTKAILRDKKKLLDVKAIKDIQKRLFNTQAQIQNDNLDYIKSRKFTQVAVSEFKELKTKAKFIDSISLKPITARANIFEFENQIIGAKKLTRSKQDILELRPYFEYSISSNFVIDNGIPYYQHLKRMPLNLNSVPTSRYDPLKPTRLASLFGWYLTNTANIDELTQRVPKKFRPK
jgi:hypothetical protein